MESPDAIIAAARGSILAREKELDALRAELRGMEAMAEAFRRSHHAAGASRAKAAENTPPKSGHVGGRQPGSITRRWRAVLRDLVFLSHEWFPAEDVIAAVRKLDDRLIRPSEVRRVFEGYAQHGYVETDASGRYKITQTAVDKFDLENLTPSENVELDAPDENAAPNGEATGAAETAGGGVPPPSPAFVAKPIHGPEPESE